MSLTTVQLENLSLALSQGQHILAREQCATGLNNYGGGLETLDALKKDLDVAYGDNLLTQREESIYLEWEKNLREVILNTLLYKAKTSMDAYAQLTRDLSIQGGVEGGNNQIRIYTGVSPATEYPTDP